MESEPKTKSEPKTEVPSSDAADEGILDSPHAEAVRLACAHLEEALRLRASDIREAHKLAQLTLWRSLLLDPRLPK